ncbi:MAG: BCCT family transporter [Pseudomonas putida]|jgi:BCCT family betaine/carnitine transporter|uniref:BCCT family transporter n=1 Tax=Pseudomonas TaxID=286 RepID=UPI0018AC2FDF|nr:BCCT family transporter [Pseudomonas guariconensis]MBF8758252.1 BCCT family transporter [Pseudomonas guariconensis]MDR0207866.1 BCCT family transporter [Pseudomonas putida]
MSHNNKKIDVFLITVSLIAVLLTVIGLALYPAQAESMANKLFELSTRTFGTSVQVLVFGSSLAVLYLAFSKYGNIRLGAGKPEYSTATWVFMFICAGMGSSTLYWGVMEWAYYYQTPGLNIAPMSAQALEYSVSYSFFHWGISAWSIYALASLAMAYHFHVRKKSGLNLASIIEAVTGFKATGPVGRTVDLIFLLTMMGALTVSLALTASTLTRGLSDLAGTPNTFTVQLMVIGAVALLFSLSSYIGIDGGLQRLSKMVCIGALLFAVVVLLVGPTQFTVNNTANAIGLMIQQYVHMSLFTDPAGDGAFTRNWTVFYWLWWVSYAPGVAMFVARVSRGRQIKEVVFALLLGGSFGCWFFFGALESYSMHQFINGQIDVPKLLSTVGGEAAVTDLLLALPWGTLFLAVYLFIMAVFCASHMDAAAYAVAATSTRNLREGEDPTPTLRLFWCIVLTLVPLAMLFAKASLSTMKTAVVLTAIPFMVILLVKIYGFFKWLAADYGQVPAYRIEEEAARLAGEEPEHQVPRSAAALH